MESDGTAALPGEQKKVQNNRVCSNTCERLQALLPTPFAVITTWM